jgi:transglutaminase-like putative cysteine protease
MTTFHIDCEFDYDVLAQSLFVFNFAVPDTRTQRVVAERVTMSAGSGYDEFRDEGGRNRFFRVDVPRGPLNVRYLATVEVDAPDVDHGAAEMPLARLPGEILAYVQTSRYVEVEAIFAFACRRFQQIAPGYGRALAICQWVKANVDYIVGSSSLTYGARDVLANRAGVCRDFAHLMIALCRALNIPARFVTAYTRYREPPPDFHAVVEVYLGHEWYLFDPSDLSPIGDLVRIGTGRDALDVPFATFFGSARMRRLSPLVEPATGSETLVSLQAPGVGIVLAPGEAPLSGTR